MYEIFYTAVGLLLAWLTIALARKYRWEGWIYGTALATLPVIYMGFGFLGDSSNAAILELLYGLPFFVISAVFLASKTRLAILLTGLFWLLHGGYDLWHDIWFVNPGVWHWYPAFCAGYDIAVGGYFLLSRNLSRTAAKETHLI